MNILLEKGFLCGLAAVMLIGMTACASTETRAPVTADEIIAMSNENVPAADIIAKIEASGTVYPLRASQLNVLEQDGVDPVVIDFMQLTYLDAVRRDERYLNNLEFRGERDYHRYLNNRWSPDRRILFENRGYYSAPYRWNNRHFDRYWRR